MEALKTDLTSQRQLLLQVQQKVDSVAATGRDANRIPSPTIRLPPVPARRTMFRRGVAEGTESGTRTPAVGATSEIGEERNAAELEEIIMEQRDWGADEVGLTALGIGDIISLTLSDVGLLVGDVCLNRLGVEQTVAAAAGAAGGV
jgi:hypothetical protein